MTKPTEGPYTLTVAKNQLQPVYGINGKNGFVGHFIPGAHPDIGEADARLLAKSWEMREWIERALRDASGPLAEDGRAILRSIDGEG